MRESRADRMTRLRRIAALTTLVVAHAATGGFAQQVRVKPVEREVVEARLRRVSGKVKERFAVVEALFGDAGLPRERLEEQRVPGAALPNVICSLPGTGEGTVVVGAHYDYSTDSGQGVIDNWTGASMLPSLYEALRVAGEHSVTYVFVGFTGEERGLLGSRHYVGELPATATKTMRAMINLDCLGLTTTKVEFRPKQEQLARWLLRIARQLKLPLDAVDVSAIGTSDHDPFRSAGMPAIAIHSVTQETWRTLHSMKDRSEAVRLDDYYDTYRLTAVFVAALDPLLTAAR